MSTTRTAVARRTPLVLVAVLSVALLVVLYAIAVRTAAGQRIDEAALTGRSQDFVLMEAITRALHSVSISSLVIATGAIVALALVQHRARTAVGVVAVVLGANLTTQFLKDTLGRPFFAIPGTHSHVASFPSGHSTVAMSLALALVLAVPARRRVPAGITGVAYAVVVGVATLASAWHRPSDVLGAFLVSLAWAAVVGAWLARPRTAPAPRITPTTAVLVDQLVIVIAALFVLAAVAMVVDVMRDASLADLEVGRAYVAALLAIGAGAAGTLAVLLAGLRGTELDA
ncbi:MAG TPA: phosphatase PAP2 family protein [Acidimicrobiia bacterium]|nr:phosphatase PAP2 family protein [Acidimicrobiia bacterium]